MIDTWLVTLTPFLTAVLTLAVPGAVLIYAGWGRGGTRLVFFAPAASIAVIALTTPVAPLVGIPWSPLPLALMTAVLSVIAVLLRRRLGFIPRTAPRRDSVFVGAAAALLAGAVLIRQFAGAFGEPENIAQRFDNIVHLNSVAYTVETGNASPFNIGATSDIGFYPSTWHAVVAMAASSTGADVATAVNAANLAFVGLLWPASALALATVLFRGRRSALLIAAGTAGAFGLFPALFFHWGVLYPNAVGYSALPAAIAALALLLRSASRQAAIFNSLLTALIIGGIALAHPNAFLAAFLLGAAFTVTTLTVRAASHPSRRSLLLAIGVSLALVAVMLLIWPLVQTSARHSGWAPWTDTASALGEALLLSPGMPPMFLVSAVMLVGLLTAVRTREYRGLIGVLAVAVLLFVVSGSLPREHWLRQWLTNPWYNDPNRLIALLPIAAAPLVTLGGVTLVDALRKSLPRKLRRSTVARAAGLTLITLVALTSTTNANVRFGLDQVSAAYADDDASAWILSDEERELLLRLDSVVPEEGLVIGSPRTGASLAYAIGGREVVQPHIFAGRDDDRTFLNRHLRDIDSDPQVCEAVKRVGVTHVLDFGTHDVTGGQPGPGDAARFRGIVNLEPGQHLELVDEETDDARLFRIVGC